MKSIYITHSMLVIIQSVTILFDVPECAPIKCHSQMT